MPTFVQEIKNVHTTEEEEIVFECLFSGTPTPDIIWYHDDKIVRNTERVKIRIQDNRTTCTIKDVVIEDHGTYVCKAVSDMGLAVTKAKLDVQEISEELKQEIRVRKAKEVKEKVKKEKVTIEKKRKEAKEKASLIREPEHKPVDVEEVQVIEKTEQIEEFTEEVSKAKPVTTIQEHVVTEATATCKKIDQPEEDVEEIMDQAKPKLSPTEPVEISEIIPEDEVKELKEKKPKTRKVRSEVEETVLEEAQVTEVKLQELIEKVEELIVHEEIKMAREVKEVLDLIKVKEFGPGENPLKELAEIGYLVRSGITVKEITVLYGEDKFPSLKSPEAQNAMVNVVERKGHGPLISEVLTEETTVDEKVLAATVGFRAFMKMVELKHATVEQVITQFTPEDFISHAWEATETKEDTIKTSKLETVHITEKTEVLIGEYLQRCAVCKV